MNKKLPITATMVIYNEGKSLERAIKSFYDLVDEIIVIHDGKCSDNSIEIAKKYTNLVFVRRHLGSAEPHRVEAYKKAKNDWILAVDGDSYLSPQLRKALSKLVKANVDIYEVSSPYWHKKRRYYGAYAIPLFRKSRSFFIGSTHEYSKLLYSNGVVKRLDYELLNTPGYENYSLRMFKKKWIPRAKVQAWQLVNFDKIPKLNYAKKEWDFPNNYRVKFPIVLGMGMSSLYHLIVGFINSFRYRQIFYFRLGIFMAMYFWILYLYVFLYKYHIIKA